MKKEEFLKKVEDNLKLLEEEEKSKIIKNYKSQITKRVKNGEKEKDVIDSFGDVNLMCKNILKKYDLKDSEKNNESISLKKEIKKFNFIESFLTFIDNIIAYSSKGNYKSLFRLLLEILIIVLIIIVLKIPFELVKSSVSNIFGIFGTNLSSTLINIIYLAIEVVYFIFAIILFINMFNKRINELIKKLNTNEKK